MPPKKKSISEQAKKAPTTPLKTPPASPAKATPAASPSPITKSPSHSHPSRTASPGDKERRKSHSVHESSTPKRPSSQPPPPQQGHPSTPSHRTPERHGSQQQQQQQHPSPSHHGNKTPSRSRTVEGAQSPSMPPAPATTPMPVVHDATTPKRASSSASNNNHSSSSAKRLRHRHGSSGSVSRDVISSSPAKSAAASLALAESPVPPPPPPTTPVPLTKRPSSSQPQPQQTSTPSRKSERASSTHGTTPAKPSTPAAAAAPGTAAAPMPSPQKPKAVGKDNSDITATTNNKNKSTAEAAAPAVKPQKRVSRNVRRQRSRHHHLNGEGATGAASASSSSSSPAAHAVERVIRESKVIAPDVSGLRCLAVHPSEQQVVVARENGSLVLYDVSFFQNIPQFVQRRHTGGQTRRTITSLAYVAVPASASATAAAGTTAASSAATGASDPAAAPTRYVLLASMLSGQVVVYDADLLVPLALHQRSGGAIWQLTAVNSACIYAAMADGSWQQLRLACRKDGAAPQLELVRVVPGISGADRALTVAASTTLKMVVGSDDAGNVHAWRLPASTGSEEDESEGGEGRRNAPRSRGLAEHESLWTTKLAKGVALSCAVVGGTQRPCVVVGTSMGDVVLLDAAHGHVFQTFAQHKGPVTTLAVHQDAVVYASGWHESLRSYRCSSEGDWHPAEVKRRTHYHEASQLAVMPHRQLMLSASRDGTILYAPLAQLFTSPAMYVAVTTQQFAYAAGRSLLLQSRFDTIEAFCMDGAGRHWVPFFGHRLEGRFHLSGLWCDAQLHYILFSTEERVGLLKVVWRAQAAMSVARIEEVLELPARTGVVDVCWSGFHRSAAAEVGDDEAAAPRVLYVLYDDSVTSITLADGYPVVNTAVQVRGKGLPADSLRPHRILCRPSAESTEAKSKAAASASEKAQEELLIYGHRGSCRLQLMADGTPEAETLVADLDDVYNLVQEVPVLRKAGSAHAGEEQQLKRAKTESTTAAATLPGEEEGAVPAELVGLSAVQQRYIAGPTLHSAAAGTTALPATLPHDVRWVARLAASSTSGFKYLGYFSRGLLVATEDSWHMVRRMTVEAAFIINDGSEVLVLERNLEKTLEALPLSWKVRRFGN